MKLSDYIVHLWMFPVVLQVVLPLLLLCGWMVIKPLVLLLGLRKPKTTLGSARAYAR